MFSFIVIRKGKSLYHRAFLLFSCVIFGFASSIASAKSFSDMVQEKDSWIYQKIHSSKEELIKKIETNVNMVFKEAVIDRIVEKMTEEFGEQAGKTLASFIGVGPFLSVAAIAAGSQGPTETQIMMQVLLEAIGEAREEIINAVEENFQDETESDLNALILSLDIYNSRDEAARKAEYQLLADMSYYAARIKKRLEQKTERAVDNSHLYMLISGLHLEIEKQYTHWLTLSIDPTASPVAIEAAYVSVLDVLVRDNFNFLNNGAIGSLSSWKSSFEKSFDTKVDYIGPVPNNEIPAGRVQDDAYYFSYKFNEKPLQFKVLGGSGCGAGYRNNYMYDALGRNVGKFVGGCKTRVSHQLRLTQENIDRVVNSHKADAESFNKYVLDGYVPVREIFDKWWKLSVGTERPKSEVDQFVDNVIAKNTPSACELSGKAGDYAGNGSGAGISAVANAAATLCAPCGISGQSFDRGASVSFYCNAR